MSKRPARGFNPPDTDFFSLGMPSRGTFPRNLETMQARHIKVAVSLLMLAAAVVIVFLRYYHFEPRVEAGPHQGLGEALAEQAVKLAGAGGRVILIAPDPGTFKSPAVKIQLKALQQGLRRAKLTVVSTNLIKIDPLKPLRVQPGDLAEILRKYSDTDVVVSLLAPSPLSPDHRLRLGAKRPRVIAICSGDLPRQIPLKPLFADNLLHAAVISRAPATAAPMASDQPDAWFNHFFQWITPQNLGDLPEPPAK